MATCRSILGDHQQAIIEKVWTLIMEDRHLTVWEIVDEVGVSTVLQTGF